MALYVYEARYRGVPRAAAPVVRDYLRGRMGVLGSVVEQVRAVGLDAKGFYIRLIVKHDKRNGTIVAAITSAHTQCQLALEEAHTQGKLNGSWYPAPCYVRCEEKP